MPDLTNADRIVIVAAALEAGGQSPFSAEALVVAVWQRFPEAFGLKGYADQYPDSNAVTAYLAGERGLIRRGFIAKMGQKLYVTTRQGRLRAHQLTEAREDRIAAQREKLLAARA